MQEFFPYFCDRCDAPYCERVNVMNLALGNVDEAYCLTCLANEYGQSPSAMAETCWGYVRVRDCFKNPWLNVNTSACPQKTHQSCYCDVLAPSE